MSSFHSLPGRSVLVLLLVLFGVYIYIYLFPPAPKINPHDNKDIKELEGHQKKTFIPRIDHVRPQDQVEANTNTIPSTPRHNSERPRLVGHRTTQGYMTSSQTTRPNRMSFGQSLTTTFRPRSLVDPSGYVKSQSTNANTVSSSGLSVSEIPSVHVKEVNCARLVEGDPVEISKAEKYQKSNPKVPMPERAYLNMTRDCPRFKKERQYVSKPVSDEEAGFPLAYSIMMYKDVEQAERLLRAIYRPQNYYCLHVDKKSPLDFHHTIESIASCFDNVFIAPKSIDVQWGWFSVVEPDLLCMDELYKRYKKWRYFINLTGQEFPLKTNLDLVRILRVYNGANNMEGTHKRRNTPRTEYIHNGTVKTERRKSPPPAGITITKGSVHITVSQAFVGFMLHNSVAQKFKDWVKDTGHPDETFFSSLNHSPNISVPGAFKGSPETDPTHYPFITRFKNWGGWPFDYPCSGKRVRMVCVFAVGDLAILAHRPELFANKFHLDYQPLALDCMEELHFNRTREELQGTLFFDTTYYKQLSFVKNHV